MNHGFMVFCIPGESVRVAGGGQDHFGLVELEKMLPSRNFCSPDMEDGPTERVHKLSGAGETTCSMWEAAVYSRQALHFSATLLTPVARVELNLQ
jgi:hypothetical protein